MKKALRYLYRAVICCIIALVVLAVLLFFFEVRVPTSWAVTLIRDRLPERFEFSAERVSYGLRAGLTARGVRLRDRNDPNPFHTFASAKSISYAPFARELCIDELLIRSPREGEQQEPAPKTEEKRLELPSLPRISIELVRPNVYGLAPESVVFDVQSTPQRLSVDRLHLSWPDRDEEMFLDGHMVVDAVLREAHGELDGTAKQSHIRPLLAAFDLDSAVAYMDAFTEVPGRVPSRFSFRRNLETKDLEFDVNLRPNMGRYNGAPFRRAEGTLRFHVLPGEGWQDLNHVIGPIRAVGRNGEGLEGTVTLTRTNGVQGVSAEVTSDLPLAHLLNVCGIVGDYVGGEASGHAECQLRFTFPAGDTNGFRHVNGSGHISIRDGQVMRAKGFSGLLSLLADKVPGFSILTDSTSASCDFVIRDGVLYTDNVYVEGTVFSLKLYGQLDMESRNLDCTARVQFAKRDSIVGKIVHPITWPFTKLLLEFRLTGTTAHPSWKYLTVVDRILEVAR